MFIPYIRRDLVPDLGSNVMAQILATCALFFDFNRQIGASGFLV